MVNLDSGFLDEVVSDAAASAIPTEEKMKRLAFLCQSQIDYEDMLANLENQVIAAKEEIKKLSELAIPELMSEVGVREFKLSNGLKVTVKPYFSGKITDQNAEECYDWLDEHGFGDIVKNEVTIKARRPDTEQLQEIMDLAAQLGFESANKLSVHHQTLSAFIKEQITEGNDLPRELFGVYTGFKTKIGR